MFLLDSISGETSLNISPIADLLREKFAFVTGGTNNRRPILTFPDHFHAELTQEKYNKLISYLTQVPRYFRLMNRVVVVVVLYIYIYISIEFHLVNMNVSWALFLLLIGDRINGCLSKLF